MQTLSFLIFTYLIIKKVPFAIFPDVIQYLLTKIVAICTFHCLSKHADVNAGKF